MKFVAALVIVCAACGSPDDYRDRPALPSLDTGGAIFLVLSAAVLAFVFTVINRGDPPPD